MVRDPSIQNDSIEWAGEIDFSIDFFRLLHVTDSFKFFREVDRFLGIPLVSGAK